MGKSGSKLHPQVLMDLVRITKYTEAELQHKYKEFIHFHPSGRMQESEFVTMYSQLFPDGDAEQFARLTFKNFDKNGDGSVDFKEFICALFITGRGDVHEKLEWAFNLYDIDGNGCVTQSECLEIITAIHAMMNMQGEEPAEITAKIFKQLDKNTDGKLTRQEFIEGSRENPSVVAMFTSHSKS